MNKSWALEKRIGQACVFFFSWFQGKEVFFFWRRNSENFFSRFFKVWKNFQKEMEEQGFFETNFYYKFKGVWDWLNSLFSLKTLLRFLLRNLLVTKKRFFESQLKFKSSLESCFPKLKSSILLESVRLVIKP